MLLLAASAGASRVHAEDWPMYQHDPARSGVTAETLALPLAEAWIYRPRYAPQPAWGDPKDKPVEGILELRRYHFDDAFQVAVADGAVFFGSSADNKVFCLDAASGSIRWTRITGGPIRLAPTFAEGRLYVGSDDGYAYCLDPKDGSIVWRFRAAPEDRRVLGHGRMISLWPLRSGVLVDGGVAYLAAGIFPGEGVFLYALDAKTGRELWRNDTCGEDPRSGISPQGYLLASKTTLYAPLGRVSPAAFDRQTGKFKRQTYFGKTIGGTYALLAGEHVYTGTEEVMAYHGESHDRFATYPGRKIIVAGDMAYLATDTELIALDRAKFPPASRKLQSLKSQLQALNETPAAKRTEAQKRQIETLGGQIKIAQQEAAATFRWRIPSTHYESLILAGGTLLAGGAGGVVAVEAATGRVVWTAKVEGTAKGLAVAGGRLFVSTDRGTIHCFGAGGGPSPAEVREPTDPELPPFSPVSPLLKRAAASILEQSGVRQGYCLVLGFETGQLARELARQSDLMVYCVSPDATKVAAAREMLDRAGVYGARVCVEQWPLDRVPYADYFANLIVSESAVLGGELPGAAEVFRMLKPEGGVAVLGQPALDPDARRAKVRPIEAGALRRWCDDARLEGAELSDKDGVWLKFVRGSIAGGGRWTHLYGNPGNTGCGDDRALRCPLGVLWFGQPGPAAMVNRHARAAGPLAVGGRLFVQGENVVMAYDAYNGRQLWEQKIPGALRENASHDGSNLAADATSFFVAVGDKCLRLEAATGRVLDSYAMPGCRRAVRRRRRHTPSADRPPRRRA
ncbi:MAG: PQQ-binding-like beta-propeller repeat protein, partial [Thermoguttaceae bacterium]|nr:PQQ-binding-like beta-propeller repeat protein [Thermoguttaceae bacterium]